MPFAEGWNDDSVEGWNRCFELGLGLRADLVIPFLSIFFGGLRIRSAELQNWLFRSSMPACDPYNSENIQNRRWLFLTIFCPSSDENFIPLAKRHADVPLCYRGIDGSRHASSDPHNIVDRRRHTDSCVCTCVCLREEWMRCIGSGELRGFRPPACFQT